MNCNKCKTNFNLNQKVPYTLIAAAKTYVNNVVYKHQMIK